MLVINGLEFGVSGDGASQVRLFKDEERRVDVQPSLLGLMVAAVSWYGAILVSGLGCSPQGIFLKHDVLTLQCSVLEFHFPNPLRAREYDAEGPGMDKELHFGCEPVCPVMTSEIALRIICLEEKVVDCDDDLAVCLRQLSNKFHNSSEAAINIKYAF